MVVVQQDRAVRRHQHVSGGNKHTKAAKPFIASSESNTAQISLICLSLLENIKFSFFSSILLDGLDRFHGDRGLSGARPPSELGVWIPPGRTAHSGISSPNKSRPEACVSSSWTVRCQILRLLFLKLTLWLRLTEKRLRGWRWEQIEVWRERECGIFQCCIIKMPYCFSIPQRMIAAFREIPWKIDFNR